MSGQTINHYPFPTNSPEHKWYAFGRYYAMFPPSFPYYATEGLTDPGDLVLDPFAGRGNSLFCAMAQERRAIGIDINPLAYLYSAARCNLSVEREDVLQRLTEVEDAIIPNDRKTRSPFETMAWSPDVRGFLRSARRELKDWRDDDVDRTLMGFIALHAQDKLSMSGLSNKLPPTIACSPSYAVRWWKEKGLTRPPSTNPIEALTDKICRRYKYGTPDLEDGQAYEGDSSEVLADMKPLGVSLLITSPPYIDVSDYWNDHWIRLWLLGNSAGKDWSRAAKFSGRENYRNLLHSVFKETIRHLAENATVLVRSDVRRHTSEICKEVLHKVFPDHKMYLRHSEASRVGESVHHGRGGTRAKEVDFLLTASDRAENWAKEQQFSVCHDTLSGDAAI